MTEEKFVIEGGIEVPESALFRAELRENKYGGVPGLDDEELASDWELERQVRLADWWPIMSLPFEKKKYCRAYIPHNDSPDFSAFATVDFSRTLAEFDKARYKVDKLIEERKDVLILLSIVKERLKGFAKYQVLKYVNLGILDMDHIVNDDMLAMVRLFLRAKRLTKQIMQLKQTISIRRKQNVELVLEVV